MSVSEDLRDIILTLADYCIERYPSTKLRSEQEPMQRYFMLLKDMAKMCTSVPEFEKRLHEFRPLVTYLSQQAQKAYDTKEDGFTHAMQWVLWPATLAGYGAAVISWFSSNDQGLTHGLFLAASVTALGGAYTAHKRNEATHNLSRLRDLDSVVMTAEHHAWGATFQQYQDDLADAIQSFRYTNGDSVPQRNARPEQKA